MDVPVVGEVNATVYEEKPKKESYITRLQRENEEMRFKLEHAEEAKEFPTVTVVEQTDDTKDAVDVTYGTGQLSPMNSNCVYRKIMPKDQALTELVMFYRNNRVKSIPREDFNAMPINQATCYIKLIKEHRIGPQVGTSTTFYKDVPLWIAAERIVNHPNYQITLVPKSEWKVYNDKLGEQENEIAKSINKTKIAKAVDTLASQ